MNQHRTLLAASLATALVVALARTSLASQTSPVGALAPSPKPWTESAAQRDRRMAWWREARFGMFIHWGLYSIPAGTWKGKTYSGASEWLIAQAGIPIQDWEPLQQQFNPVNYDPRAWARAAKAAGMKYVVITSKHHEGFALWDAPATTWDVAGTPYQRDLLKPLVEACRAEGLRIGFYYSIMDWHHPDYLPRKAWDPRPGVPGDFPRYVAWMKSQLRDLLTRYGKIDVLWFDGEWENTWTDAAGIELERMVRQIQPEIIINNRVAHSRSNAPDAPGDFGTPEQEIPANGFPGQDWESCMTMNGSWGFHASDTNWKSPAQLIQNLVECTSKGGNYLLNVGPTSLGEIPTASLTRLRDVGEWMGRHGEAVYGAGAGPFPRALPWGRVTRKGNHLYAVIFDPDATEVTLTGLDARLGRPAGVGDLAEADVRLDETPGGPRLNVPEVDNGGLSRVVRLPLLTEPTVTVVPIRPDPDGHFLLSATEAEVRGTNARYEPEKQAIGFWTRQADELVWDVEVPAPGVYAVEIELACDDASAGSLLSAGGVRQRVEVMVPGTGGWDRFRVVRPEGTLRLAAGRQPLILSAKTMPQGAVANVRSVRLIRQ